MCHSFMGSNPLNAKVGDVYISSSLIDGVLNANFTIEM